MRAYGAADAWAAVCYGETNSGTVDFLRNQFSTVGNALTEYGRKFLDSSLSAFNHFNGSEALKFARSVVAKYNRSFDTDRIVDLSTLSELQSASLQMQRWIMANPNVRKMYQKQLLDGYSNTYVDAQPNDIGEDHYDYRRVMDGIGVEDEEGYTCFTTYGEILRDGDRELIFEEQLAILGGWNATDVLLAIGKDDPTSTEGGKL